MKYNLGCGADYHYGWVNVDRFPDARPDVVMDLETFSGTAILATPSVSLEDRSMQFPV